MERFTFYEKLLHLPHKLVGAQEAGMLKILTKINLFV